MPPAARLTAMIPAPPISPAARLGDAIGWRPAPSPEHPLLFINPRSGGGTAARLSLDRRRPSPPSCSCWPCSWPPASPVTEGGPLLGDRAPRSRGSSKRSAASRSSPASTAAVVGATLAGALGCGGSGRGVDVLRGGRERLRALLRRRRVHPHDL